MGTVRTRLRQGFTLVEMLVIAPIVILMIGAFIALIVNLTGEVLSTRGANSVTYDIQGALNRIEQDVKLSSTYLATNSINVATNRQGYSATPSTNGGTIAFTNIDRSGSGGSTKALILNGLVTDGNPLALDSNLVYLADQPNSCGDFIEYSKNTPMSMNIIYFVDTTNTLWRRTVLPTNYKNTDTYCGSKAPWQQPSCSVAYTSSTYCTVSDERIMTDISPSDFQFNYYTSADASSPDSTAANPSFSDAIRNTAMQSTPTLGVSITARKLVAGRSIERTSTLRTTRLDSNASAIAKVEAPTAPPSAPVPTGVVSDGHNVIFTWPRVAGATSYTLDYCIVRVSDGETYSSTFCDTNSRWVSGGSAIDNNSRRFEVTQAGHDDYVEVRIRAVNSFGPSTYGKNAVGIPRWAPLLLKGNWTDYNGSYNTAAYTKTKSGAVIIKGLVKNPTTLAVWDQVALIPPDYMPTQRLIFGTIANGNTHARVDVYPTEDGGVFTFNQGSNPGWLSLEGIQYIPQDATNPSGTLYTRTAPSLQNGWVNYGGSYAPASYMISSSGRVFIQGLIKSGTLTDHSPIFTLPASYTPAQYMHMNSESGGFAHIGVSASPSALVTKTTGSNGYYSINTNYLPASASVTWSNMSLVNGWVTTAGAYTTAQYTKDSDGVVQLKGLVRNGTATAGTTITTLPAGFRPKARVLLANVSNNAIGRVDILPDGRVTINAGVNSWFSLDNVSFVADN